MQRSSSAKQENLRVKEIKKTMKKQGATEDVSSI